MRIKTLPLAGSDLKKEVQAGFALRLNSQGLTGSAHLELQRHEKIENLSNPPFAAVSDPESADGCLVADQLRIRTKTLESTGADNKKGLNSNWILTLQKNDIIILRWRSVFS